MLIRPGRESQPMQIAHSSADRLVLTADRRLVAFCCILAAPFAIWLGILIVRDGQTEWFGYAFAGLGAVMGVIGLAAAFARISLVLDRPDNLIRFTIRAFGRRRHWTMPLDALDHVDLRSVVTNRMEHQELVFVPLPGTDLRALKITEFWTRSAAQDAHAAVTLWLKQS